MAGCVCAVEFADGAVGGGDARVCHECYAGGATCAVEANGDGGHGSNPSKKILAEIVVSGLLLGHGRTYIRRDRLL